MNTQHITITTVTNGVFYVDIKKANTRILCGAPSDVVKLLMKKGLLCSQIKDGFFCENGPTAILLSDVTIQNFSFSNLCEFPILQMLYRQGLVIPNHPNNTGIKPIVMGLKDQVSSQIEYIFRGNYGLISQEEIEQTGIDAGKAKAMMNMKLKFAFGALRSSDELIASIYLDDNKKAEISNEVFIKREGLNNYKITYQNEEVDVDLNLEEDKNYEIPYELDFFKLQNQKEKNTAQFNAQLLQTLNYQPGLCPVAERMHAEALVLCPLVREPLTLADMDDLADAIEKVLAQAPLIQQFVA